MRRLSGGTLILLLAALLAQDRESSTLKEVRVEGNTITDDEMIRYTSGLRPGVEIGAQDFARSVKRLWQVGLFSDVQIKLNQDTPQGLVITIAVQENPVLGQYRFEGNKKLKARKFEEELNLTRGQRIKPHQVHETTQKIKELYAQEGYLLAEVEAELREPEDLNAASSERAKNTRDLIFKIRENRKVKLRRIEFEGNQAYSDRKLRRKLKETKQQRWYLFWRSGFDQDKFEEDKLAVTTYYRNNGYRDFTILDDTLFYDPSRRKLSLRLVLKEGPRYRYRNFSWEGNHLFSTAHLRRNLNLTPGDYYSEEEFNEAVYNRVQGLYMDRGYIYSQILPQFTPVGEDSLDVHFALTENHQVYIRNIYIHGNTKTRENVIRRELKVFPGDVFNREYLIRSQRDLFILNYFSDVVPDVTPVDEDQVDLEITVEEKSSDQASANIGFTGVYGMTGGGSLQFNNFLGRGQQLALSANVGTQYSFYTGQKPAKYRSFSLRFVDPMVYDTPNRVGFSIFYSFRGQATNYYFPLDLIIQGGSVEWGRRFKWPDDFFRGYWVFSIVRKNYRGLEEDLERYVKGLERTMGINITQVLSRDSRDRPEFTTRGARADWTATFSGGPLGGNEDFQKHILNLEWYTPTFWKFVLMSSFKIGVIRPLPSAKGEISIIPFDEKFIMGGNGLPYGTMLRGYPDNSLGPQSSSGQPIGGDALLKYTLEYRIPFSQQPVVYGLVFAEMGNVWSSPDLTEVFYLPRQGALDLRRSAGVGVRFFMPMIGMLGFDMGYGFDDIGDKDGQPHGWEYTIIFGQGQY